MRRHRVMAVCRREYITRVKTRGFWVATALIPLFMVGITVLPSLFAMRQQGTITLGVQDQTGRILEPLTERIEARYGDGMTLVELSPALDEDTLGERVESRELDAYVVITDEAIEGGHVNYYGQVTTNIIFQDRLEDVFADVFTADRLRIRGYDPDEIELLTTRVRIEPVGIGDDRAASGEIRFIMAYGMFFTLYMMLMLYGQNIMRGVLEEKTSRIVEIVVSSLTPKELLVGKVLGIGAVGFTQLGIWLLTLLVLSGTASVGMIAALRTMPAIPFLHILNFMGLFILGFLVYAILFAAVGSIHNNEQEAQQYNAVVMMPIIIPVIFIFSVINAPNSTMSVVLSFIPLFTPLIMVARVAVGAVPVWQIAVAYAILIAFITLEVAFVSRIYRVGILMYGKRPSLPEVMKWMRY